MGSLRTAAEAAASELREPEVSVMKVGTIIVAAALALAWNPVAAAQEIAALIRERAAESKPCVLGLATGSTPVNVYAELVRLYREEGLSLANVVTFNLDEYHPMQPDCLQSYSRFMNEHLFDLVDIARANIHIPDGTIAQEQVADYCA